MSSVLKVDRIQSDTGTVNVASKIEFPVGSAAAPSIFPTGDTNTGIFFPAADTIAFAEGGAEAMRIDANRNVGIGTNAPSSILHVSQTAPLISATSTNNSSGLRFNVEGTATTTYRFQYGGNTQATIDSDGYLRLAGGGIQFNGDTAAANALDDYEEGTFTATVGGTWSTSPTNLGGQYIKIGNMVFIRMQFVGGAKAGSTAGWLAGLPFAGAASGSGAVVDADIVARGSVLFDNSDRMWLTNNSFSVGQNRFTGAYLLT